VDGNDIEALRQFLEAWATQHGVDVHDPTHLTRWDSTIGLPGNRRSMGSEYREGRRGFQNSNPNATPSQINNFRNTMDSAQRGFYRR
jgi:hypothetical protein